MSNSEPSQPFENGARARLRERYERLWRETIGKIQTGNIEPDPVLAARLPDRRRGLTVIARPSPNVRQRIAAFLDELRGLEPEQYYYAPSEFHLTVLSLFTATVSHERFFAQTERFIAAADAALRKVAPIQIDFAGVTVSPAGLLVQGFFEDEALNELRDALRHQLRASGLDEGLDVRYRLETAHMTVVRFRARLRNSGRFAAAFERARHRPFGATDIQSVSLVKNDWYMTRQVLQTLKRYRLSR